MVLNECLRNGSIVYENRLPPERIRRPGVPRKPRVGAEERRQAPGRQLLPRGVGPRGGRRQRGGHRLQHHLQQPEGPVHQVQPRSRPVETVQGSHGPGARMG